MNWSKIRSRNLFQVFLQYKMDDFFGGDLDFEPEKQEREKKQIFTPIPYKQRKKESKEKKFKTKLEKKQSEFQPKIFEHCGGFCETKNFIFIKKLKKIRQKMYNTLLV